MITTINNKHKELNVPNLRFPEFEGEWSVTTLQKDCIVNPTNDKIADKFVYIDLESVTQGQLNKQQVLAKEEAPSRAQRVLHAADILFQCVRPYQKNNYIVKDIASDIQWVASTGYAQIRTQIDNPTFLYYVLNTPKYNKAVMVRCTGSSYPAINSDDLSKIPFCKCGIAEQKKIASFLSLLDERIATQNKIIEDLKKLKSAISKKLLCNDKWTTYKIQDIAEIGRGRVISSVEIDRQKHPLYPVYSSQTSNDGIMGYLDSYMFDGEYITWTTDGANAGTVFYRKGKFNCTNVCGTLKIQPKFDCYFVSLVLQQATQKYVSSNLANPKLMNNTMASIKISMPNIEMQKQLSKVFQALDSCLLAHQRTCTMYLSEKQYLLHQMFT